MTFDTTSKRFLSHKDERVTLPEPVVRLTGKVDGVVGRLRALLNDPKNLDGAITVLAMTDPIARTALGILRGMPVADRYEGPHPGFVMLPFLNPKPARFNDAKFGAWYAAGDVTTAQAEKGFHLERWLRASPSIVADLTQQIVSARIEAPLENCGRDRVDAAVYDPDPDNYAEAVKLARARRAAGGFGLWYESVRHGDGWCCAVFRPSVITSVALGHEMLVQWDGKNLRWWAAA